MSQRDEDGSKQLWLVLTFDVLITLGEFIAAWVSGSLLLWGNFLTGLYDGALLGFNIWGIGQEHRGNILIGSKIAFWSDVLLAAGFAGAIAVGVARLLNGSNHQILGLVVLVTASAAATVNYCCSKLCPANLANGQSAKLKMQVGAMVGTATFASGVLLHFCNCWWVDPLMTMLVGTGVVWLTISRLRDRSRQLIIQRVLEPVA